MCHAMQYELSNLRKQSGAQFRKAAGHHRIGTKLTTPSQIFAFDLSLTLAGQECALPGTDRPWKFNSTEACFEPRFDIGLHCSIFRDGRRSRPSLRNAFRFSCSPRPGRPSRPQTNYRLDQSEKSGYIAHYTPTVF